MIARSLAVQSVLFGNPSGEIIRAAEAVANAAHVARETGVIGSWEYLVGDCSPDPVLDSEACGQISAFVELGGGTFQYTVFGANLGSAAGHNALARLSSSELMVILNPDAQVSPDAFDVMARDIRNLVASSEARQIPVEHPKDYVAKTGTTAWSSTACLMTSRVAFDEVSGFDNETFFLYCDDVDYTWRLRLAGYEIMYQPAATVFHDKRLGINSEWLSSEAEVFYSAEAALLLAFKYSNEDLLAELLDDFGSSKSKSIQNARTAFLDRQAEGRLPTPIDRKHKVATFVNGNYALHRY